MNESLGQIEAGFGGFSDCLLVLHLPHMDDLGNVGAIWRYSPLARLLTALTFLLASLCALATTGFAADDPYPDFVKRASAGDLSLDFRLFRIACLKSESCDARGDNKDYIAMRRAFQAKDYDGAAKQAEALINKGFVNIEAHIICAQAYEALGEHEKAKFHHDVASALIKSILSTGDGKSEKTAFEVIGTFEEHLIMNVLGLPILGSQSLITRKPHSYDVLEVNDPKTGNKVSVYFNIDLFYPPKGL